MYVSTEQERLQLIQIAQSLTIKGDSAHNLSYLINYISNCDTVDKVINSIKAKEENE
jgi:3-methyladenine DNA glycosylase AlkD